ncbi:hypothetical protein OH76DRAFT_848874 [Lentinus brumalis]|uniref:Uncharacterized protein n=1 Tax=Lentinus brumalis TaxID=2498619 RepID=A0A371DQU4_9APHY|nr:hypothetical protein OH76DRAFT_848874 [Polyporus brumalis]
MGGRVALQSCLHPSSSRIQDMPSSFGALRALLVLAASLCSPVFSFPATSPSSLAQRSFKDYYDNLIYLDSKKSNLYWAVSIGGQSYAACLDNKWSGLATYGDKAPSGGSTQSITIEEVSIQVQDGRTEVGLFDVEVDLEYFHATSWPSNMPKLGVSGVDTAYIGIDISKPSNPYYTYMSYKWPKDYSKWYYDMMISYDWMDVVKSTDIDFAGVIVVGKTLSWTDLLDISSSQATQYGLPPLDGISNQPYIYLQDDGYFYLDNCFWVGGKQYTWNSEVPKTPSGKTVADIRITERWSIFPDEIVKAIYAGLQGAKYYPQSTYGYYQIPCDSKIEFEFAIDGHKYVLVEEALIAPNPWGDQCIGSIFTKGQAVAAVPEYDIYFGFQFISSFYYRAGLNHDNNKPYYKLLPLPSPKSGDWWKSYTSAPSYPYATWKPTYSATYGGGSDKGYTSQGNDYKPVYTTQTKPSNTYYYTSSTPIDYSPKFEGPPYSSPTYYTHTTSTPQYSYHTTSSSTYYSQPTYPPYNGGYSSHGYDDKTYETHYTSSSSHNYYTPSYSAPPKYETSSVPPYHQPPYSYSSPPKYETSSVPPYHQPPYSYSSEDKYKYSSTYEDKSKYSTTYDEKKYSSTYDDKSKYSTTYDDKKYTSTYEDKSKYSTTTYDDKKYSSTYDDKHKYSSTYEDKSKYSTTYDDKKYTSTYEDKSKYSTTYDDKYKYTTTSTHYDYKPSSSNWEYKSSPTYYSSATYDKDHKYTDTYQPYSTPAKIAGNLAEEGDDNSDTDWKSKAHLYEIIIIALASVLGLGVIGAIIACVVSRKKKDNGPRPSAYRNIHDAESTEPKIPLYGAEGGQSRYSDPYGDKE